MNRIVIVGNGFDLAHGLKTSYADFALDLINSDFEVFRNEGKQPGHGLYSFIVYPAPITNPIDLYKLEPLTSLKHRARKFNEEWRLDSNFPGEFLRQEDFRIDWKMGEKISLVAKSRLFMRILTMNGWADIEKEYYNQLVDLFKKNDRRELQNLNREFFQIKELLVKYLDEVNKSKTNKNYSIERLLQKIEQNHFYNTYDIATKKRIENVFSTLQPQNLVILNFNYTSTLSRLYTIDKVHEIPIHGTVFDKNAIIFGYGDEKSEFHKALESADYDDWILYFKSHYYGAKSNYSNLLNFLEIGGFDVVIIGHSLGLSDRLMLQTIFEHKNCKFIHLAHTGGDGHFRKRIAISRHFNDKKLMRSRLLEENKSLKFNRTPD